MAENLISLKRFICLLVSNESTSQSVKLFLDFEKLLPTKLVLRIVAFTFFAIISDSYFVFA